MKLIIVHLVAAVATMLLSFSAATADSIDKYINDLKSESPGVRAKAAFELGCG